MFCGLTPEFYPLRSTNRAVVQERQANQSNALVVGQPGVAAAQMAGQVAALAFSMMSGGVSVTGNSFGQSYVPARTSEPNHGLARLLAGTQSQAAAPLLALTDGSVGGPATAAPAAVATVATAPAAAPVAAEPMPPADVVQPPPETPAAVNSGLANSVSEQNLTRNLPQGVPSRVEESVRALATAHYNEAPVLPAVPADGSKLKRPYVRKKPSAAPKSTAALKKPAAASAETDIAVKEKPAAKKRPAASAPRNEGKAAKKENLVHVSKARRLRERPTGCATCRNTPGCCPSCWRKRGYSID